MALWLVLTSFLLIVSQQVSFPRSDKNPERNNSRKDTTDILEADVTAANLQLSSSRSESPGSEPGEGAGAILSLGVNCQLSLERLYISLLKAYDVWYDFIQIGPQMQQSVMECALPPYTSAEKKELCLEEAAESYGSQTMDLANAMSGVLPEIVGSTENLEKCIESAPPAAQPYKKISL